MRVLAFLAVLIFIIDASCFSQTNFPSTKISLKIKEQSLDYIIKEISRVAGVKFSYVNDLIPGEKKFSVKCKEKDLSVVLKELLSEVNLSFEQVGSQIVLKKEEHNIRVIKPDLLQTIRGEVIDNHSHAHLPGATVILLGEKGYKITTANNEGKFRLEKIPMGRYDLKVTYIGYKESIIHDLAVNSGKENVVTVFMEENIIEGEAITVYGEKDKSSPNNDLVVSSVTNIRPEEVSRFAGSRLDPSRMISSYAGVTNGRDPRNDIIVRGNSAFGLLWRFEGVDIPNPNHYTFIANSGGAFSILNNNLLANSDFIAGAFPAEYGNKNAAVLDIKMRNGNNEKRENTLQVGLTGLEFTTEGPIGKNGASYLTSYRFFNFRGLNSLGLNIVSEGVPVFQDGTFKVNIPIKKSGNIVLWGIGGKSNITLSETDYDTIKWGKASFINDNSLRSDMYALGGSLSHTISSKTHGKLTLSSSGSYIKFSNEEIYRSSFRRNVYTLRNNEGHNLVNYTIMVKANSRHFVKAGITLKHLFYNNFDIELIQKDSTYINGLNNKGSSFFTQAYFHWKFNLSPKFELNSGLYSHHFAFNNTASIEPRIALKVKLDPDQAVTFAVGKHSQMQPLAYYQYKIQDSVNRISDYNKKLRFTNSLHVIAGYKYAFASDWRFKTEAYYQYLYKVPVSLSKGAESYSALNEGSEYSFTVLDSTVNKGTGRNYGVEFTLEKYFSKNFYLLSSISFLRSTYRGADGIERGTTFDVDHIFNLLGGKVFYLDDEKRRQISLDGRLTHSGGRRIIKVDEEKTASDSDGIIHYDWNNAFRDRVKDYFRADLKITYNVNRPKASHNLFVAIDNILNTKNENTYRWNPVEGRVTTFYQFGIFPYLGYRVHF